MDINFGARLPLFFLTMTLLIEKRCSAATLAAMMLGSLLQDRQDLETYIDQDHSTMREALLPQILSICEDPHIEDTMPMKEILQSD